MPLQQKTKSYISSSADLICRITEYCNRNTNTDFARYPISLDIEAMYSSIPINEAIQATQRFMQQNNLHHRQLDHENITTLLKVVLNEAFFHYNGKVFKQVQGLPMGSRLSGILATLFINHLETMAFERCHLFNRCYSRYVDDVFLFAKDKREAEHILSIFNSLHQSIHYKLESPNEKQTLSLLDFGVHISVEKAPVFTFYRKTARKDTMLHFRTALPTSNKTTTIRNERKRIEERCTFQNDKEKAVFELNSRLTTNGYPTDMHVATRSVRPKQRRTTETQGKPVFHLQLPFVSDEMDRRLKKTFIKFGFNIRLIHKTSTIQNHLNNDKTNSINAMKCTIKHCPTKASNLCHRKNVVYEAKCKNCNSIYIGSTTRHFHLRVREHLTTKNSAVFQHAIICQPKDISFSILCSAKDGTDLALKEGILIRKNSPTLNNREELLLWEENLI